MNASAANSESNARTSNTRRLLSSRSTDLTRRIFPWSYLVLYVFVLAIFSFESSNSPRPDRPPTPFLIGILLVGFLGSVYIFKWCKRLKHVALDRDLLVVSDFANFEDELRLGPDEIEKVVEHRWQKGHPITIHLRSVTKYGDQIHFIPYMRLAFVWQKHPAAEAIEEFMKSKSTAD